MNDNYTYELQEEIDFMFKELAYLQEEISNARNENDTNQYARLMRVYMPVQKQYLKLCAEQEKRVQAESAVDPLMEFNA